MATVSPDGSMLHRDNPEGPSSNDQKAARRGGTRLALATRGRRTDRLIRPTERAPATSARCAQVWSVVQISHPILRRISSVLHALDSDLLYRLGALALSRSRSSGHHRQRARGARGFASG